MKIFLAQESRIIGNILRQALQSSRYSSATTLDIHCGADLLTALGAESDTDTLVILDWNLPGFDVPTFLASRAGSQCLSRAALLVCVNPADLPLAGLVLPLEGADFIVRPFSDEDLCTKIGSLARPTPEPSRAATTDVLQEILADARAQEYLPSLLSLPSAVIARMFEGCPSVHHPPGTEILVPGQRVEALPVVTAGEVELEGPGDDSVRGPGECFGERAFVCGEPAKVLVRTLTPVETVLVPKERMAQLARRHPSLQRFLQSLLVRASAGGPRTERPQLSGTLASLGFADLVQFLHAGRKTGLLTLENEELQGRIYFEAGQVIDASVGTDRGKDAFFGLSRSTDARFTFQGGVWTERRMIEEPTLKLLMESFCPVESGDVLPSDSTIAYCTKAG